MTMHILKELQNPASACHVQEINLYTVQLRLNNGAYEDGGLQATTFFDKRGKA